MTVPAPGQLGELQIRGEMVTTGYLGHPRHSAELFDGDWLRPGDLAFQMDGEYFLMGRLKEMAIVHGQNFFPKRRQAGRDAPVPGDQPRGGHHRHEPSL